LTGHTGFVGRALIEASAGKPAADWRISTLPDGFDIRSGTLVDVIAPIHADAVLHLAALTSVADSYRDPQSFFAVNFHGTWNLLSALRATGFNGRLLYVSSGDCYGAVPEHALPIRETQPMRPRNPYAMSKVAAEALCYQWAQSDGLDVVIARPFNHIGPGQDDRFAVASFARQIARIDAGLQDPRIVTGDLDVTRDFTDVRDIVSAYFALIERGHRAEEYNVGSGHEVRVRDLLARLASIAGIEVQVVTDSARLRPDEQRRAVADVSKIARDTGWRAMIPLERTLVDTFEYWSERIKHE
jgi:GDP-4-dehydro-6-deoxy-D-mannose reductase